MKGHWEVISSPSEGAFLPPLCTDRPPSQPIPLGNPRSPVGGELREDSTQRTRVGVGKSSEQSCVTCDFSGAVNAKVPKLCRRA